MIIGFTGTQGKISDRATCYLSKLFIALKDMGATELHHGDCIGADTIAHRLWGSKTVIHPPIDNGRRSFCVGRETKYVSAKPFIERNHDIVDACQVLVACPRTMREEIRSGTWATVRYARKLGKIVFIVSER